MSADPENEYFSDGMTEEIINALARIPGLQVASRTSSLRVQGQGGRDRGGGPQARRLLGAGGERPQDRQPDPDRRPAGERDQQLPALVGDVRPPARGRLRHPGRDQPGHRGRAEDQADGRGQRAAGQAGHREPRGLHPLPQGAFLRQPAGRARPPQGAVALRAGARRRPRLRPRLFGHRRLLEQPGRRLGGAGSGVPARPSRPPRAPSSWNRRWARRTASIGKVLCWYEWDFEGASRALAKAVRIQPELRRGALRATAARCRRSGGWWRRSTRCGRRWCSIRFRRTSPAGSDASCSTPSATRPRSSRAGRRWRSSRTTSRPTSTSAPRNWRAATSTRRWPPSGGASRSARRCGPTTR